VERTLHYLIAGDATIFLEIPMGVATYIIIYTMYQFLDRPNVCKLSLCICN